MMRVLICGDRNWTDKPLIEKYITTLPEGSTVIHGACRGADLIAEYYALKYGHIIMDFPAPWGTRGAIAGPLRNKEMLNRGKPELVVAFHRDLSKSRGTKNMILQAERAGIPVKLIQYEKDI